VTHGEPHRANVIRTAEGFRLVDWDTTLVAPRERDLFIVLDAARTGWSSYATVVAAELNEDTLRLYHAWWELSDIDLRRSAPRPARPRRANGGVLA
jgi:spectinomycin phosphotransferase